MRLGRSTSIEVNVLKNLSIRSKVREPLCIGLDPGKGVGLVLVGRDKVLLTIARTIHLFIG